MLTDSGSAGGADDHELAGNRRVIGPGDVLPRDLRGQEDRSTLPIPTSCPITSAIDLFRDAVKRGVRVRVMVAGSSNDTMVARLNSLRLYGALLKAGVEVLEYNRTMMHHKIMVVDGLWSTVGTTNFDNRSFSHNEENNVCVCDEAVAARADRDLRARHSGLRGLTLDGWRSAAAAAEDGRSAGLVRPGSSLGHEGTESADQKISPKKLHHRSWTLPKIERCILPGGGVEPRRRAHDPARNPSSRCGRGRRRTLPPSARRSTRTIGCRSSPSRSR